MSPFTENKGGGLPGRICKSEGGAINRGSKVQDRRDLGTGEDTAVNWYALYTRHQHEKSVTQVLANKGFETLLPLYRVAHRWKDRTQVVHLPVFPCYTFVRTSLERKLEILKTPGACWLVGKRGYATPIALEEIEAVRVVCESSARLEPHTFVKCGDRVRVHKGPLTGIEGILVRTKNQCRVVLSLQLLRQSAAVEVDLAMIELLPLRAVAIEPVVLESKKPAW